MAESNTSAKWTGPSVKEMVAGHTLAKEIISRHNDPCPVFDASELAILRRFVADPTQAAAILREAGMADAEGEALGTAAMRKGSLAGCIAAAHGSDKPKLTDDEIRALKQWFDNGGGKTATEL
jgi:hypothetical protein